MRTKYVFINPIVEKLNMSKHPIFLCNVYAIALMVTAIAFPSLRAQQMEAPVVAVGEVITTQSAISRRYTGRLTSPASVELVARVAGEMLEQQFTEGDFVKKGQVLYRLDDVRYRAAVQGAEANIKRCEASLKYTESNYNRVKNLFEKGVTTQDALEAAEMNYHADVAGLESAKAALITAQDDLKNTQIVAPIDGKIGLTNYTVGNYLTPSSGVLATIVQLNPIRLSFSIANRDFLSIFGTEENFRQDARVTITLADGTPYSVEGIFEFMNNEANKSTDTITLFVSFANDDFKLRPGSTVNVNVEQKSTQDATGIEPSALMSDAQGTYVYVVGDDLIAQRRDVKIGSSTKDVQIVLEGLTAGERVVTRGTHKVIPGTPVKLLQ